MSLSTLTALLLSLPFTLAWYPCYSAPLTLAQFVGEPQCSANLSSWHSFVEVYIPDHAPYEIWNVVGNFEDLSWQAVTNLTTNGTKNSPGNTHTQPAPSGPATEQLNIYVGPVSHPPSAIQALFFMQFSLIQLDALEDVYFDNLHDLLMARSGSWPESENGTILSWESSGCSNTSTGATQLYDNLHLHNLNNTIAILNGGSATPPT